MKRGLLLIFLAASAIGCSDKYCPTYSNYEYNKKIVAEKSYKAEDAKMKRKAKKFTVR
jgi:hypothetical protein